MELQVIEVMLNSQDLAKVPLGGHEGIAARLREALAAVGLGTVTGASAGGGVAIVDVSVPKERVPEALGFLKQQLRLCGAPRTTVLSVDDTEVPIGGDEPWGRRTSRPD
ncbi:hypothetical protein OWM54_07810 [Myxococcus sp. MISCRS1]|jgi:hypothetical protein|uniref:hypothetical protein n=1 Tax=Myxococcus TaxID=32 RepID=UPI001144381F|nr:MULTISPECIES: hypothetical protein [Myxococcus]MBZ4401193.1 hypothetical protein [Myxococcus sp. AS-1-15]MCK8503970.1 hypothetical protein [Myxococcus fulvus]MCY0997048.1 hypothetical protein [Myxococcus sp. MISCRS1]BDT32932.1 hypothetical protein MFMH1_26010 [Myxococcus sp. MH1]